MTGKTDRSLLMVAAAWAAPAVWVLLLLWRARRDQASLAAMREAGYQAYSMKGQSSDDVA